jgi:ribonucleoside-diphosphate reductase alpha chain
MVKIVEADTVAKVTHIPRKYSPYTLDAFDKGRHISVTDAYKLITAQKDSRLDVKYLKQAKDANEIAVYKFGRKNYFDRLDMGRVYHKEKKGRGLTIERCFSTEGVDSFDSLGKWGRRDLRIDGKDGEVIFNMKNAEFPESWTKQQAKIVAQKYFLVPNRKTWKEKLKKKIGVDHEDSLKHLITRVSNFFAEEGWKLGYFATRKDRDIFRDELKFLQTHRMAAFNSPVYFNAGIYQEYGIEGAPSITYTRDPKTGEVNKVTQGCYVHPVTHACFIRGSKDNLVDILKQITDEGAVFGHGSGVGSNIGALREKGSILGGGGKPSGPLSFMEVFDAAAGAIKSGGKSRRAARMQTMDCDHPDIEDFAECKVREDKKALILMENGYSGGMDGEAYTTVSFQNTNLSVRLDDNFFRRLKRREKIDLISVNKGTVVGQISAEKLLKKISFGSWRIGDPGVQYKDRIELDNTCPLSGRINSSNPCGEYLYLDDSSCNLASANLLAFTDLKGKFDYESYSRANRIMVIAQDIANSAGSYPVENIARQSPELRTVGLGFTNLGATLMRKGIAYDSDKGRAFAAATSAIMTANAYETSAELAEHLGTFTHFELNRKPMLDVLKRHQKNLEAVMWEELNDESRDIANSSWSKVIEDGGKSGFRNAQATVQAPTGTISYLLGCDTTGVESAFELIIHKTLAGGGEVTLVNREIPNALKNLGYSEEDNKKIQEYIKNNNSVLGCPDMRPEHRNIFATAKGNAYGKGAIPFESHIKMVAAIQPFISGGISKTMNLPEQATVKQIYDGFILGHELGLKGLTAFRDNGKPITAMGAQRTFKKFGRGEKEDLLSSRPAHEFELEIIHNKRRHPVHVLVSEYENGRPGQITFLAYKSGKSIGELLEISGVSASKALKRGLSLEDVVEPWIDQEIKPNGLVFGHKHVHHCKSILDAAARIILLEYKGRKDLADDPEAVDLTELQGFKNGAFRFYDRKKVDAWDFKAVMKDHEYGGFAKPEEGTILPQEVVKRKDLARCPNCEEISLRRISSNCFSCSSCGHNIGGCTE